MKYFFYLTFYISSFFLFSNENIDNLLDEAKLSFNNDWTSAEKLVEKAYQKSLEEKYAFGVVRSMQYKGWIQHKSGDIGKAVNHYLKVAELTQDENDSSLIHFRIFALMNLGSILQENSLADLAIDHYLEAIISAESIGYAKQKILLLENLQRAYRDVGSISEAVMVNHEIIQIVSENSNRYLSALKGLGIAHQLEGNYMLAEFYYNQLLESAKVSNDISQQADALHNLGNIFFLQGSYLTAQEYFQKGINKRNELQEPRTDKLSNTYRDLSETYFELKMYSKALESAQLSARHLDPECFECQVKTYSLLESTMAMLGDEKQVFAYQNAKKDAQSKLETQQLRVKYESRQPELRLIVDQYYAKLESDQKIQASHKAFLSAIVGIVALLFLLAGYHIYSRTKARKLIETELRHLDWEAIKS